jgi:hypothetical protein
MLTIRQIGRRLLWLAWLWLKRPLNWWQARRLPDSLAIDIPYFSQFGSADQAEKYALKQVGLETDPNWQLTGADSQAEYCRWASHCCGMACLKMALHSRHPEVSVIGLAKACQQYGGYVWQDGQLVNPGLRYPAFIRFVNQQFGWPARLHRVMSLTDICHQLAAGYYVMASVHPAIGHPESFPASRGGHLVLLTGYDHRAGTVRYHDPGGPMNRQRDVTIAMADFDRFFAHKGLSLRPPVS